MVLGWDGLNGFTGVYWGCWGDCHLMSFNVIQCHRKNCELIRRWRLDFLLARDSLQAASPHCFVRQLIISKKFREYSESSEYNDIREFKEFRGWSASQISLISLNFLTFLTYESHIVFAYAELTRPIPISSKYSRWSYRQPLYTIPIYGYYFRYPWDYGKVWYEV